MSCLIAPPIRLAHRRAQLPSRAVLASALGLLVAGCMTMPSVSVPTLNASEAAVNARSSATQGESALTAADMPTEWWQLFNDATLSSLEVEAATANLDVQAAGARVQESGA